VRAAVLADGVVSEIEQLRGQMSEGSIAVVAPDDLCDDLSDALSAAGLEHGRATTSGLDQSLTVVPVSVVKGLELDAVVVVEPSRIVTDQEHGMRALYVALTRSTQRLSIVHCDDLPEPLR
jgi:DNA helicase IV